MIKIVLRYGIIGGLIVATPMVWRMLTAEPGEMPLYGMLVSYLVMIVALTTVFLGIKHYRDKVLGGVIKFGPAFLLGLGISFVASVLVCRRLGILLGVQQVRLRRVLLESHARVGESRGTDLAKATADVEAFQRMYANPLTRIPMVFIEIFPVGVLISLISAALLRNSRLLPARPPA